MSIIIPANSAVAGGYDVENSCRFNSASSSTLVRTQGTATNLKKFVWSCWIKRSTLGAGQYIVYNYNSGTDQAFFYFRGTDDLRFFNRSPKDRVVQTRFGFLIVYLEMYPHGIIF